MNAPATPANVAVTFASSEKRHFNARETAGLLDICEEHLAALGKEQPIFAPSGKFARKSIYPRKQIEIISLVMRDKLTPEQGAELWRRIQDREIADVLREARGEDVSPRRGGRNR